MDTTIKLLAAMTLSGCSFAAGEANVGDSGSSDSGSSSSSTAFTISNADDDLSTDDGTEASETDGEDDESDNAGSSSSGDEDTGSDSSNTGEEVYGALYFDGDDEATSASIAQSTLPPEFTIELWVQLDDGPYYGVLIDARNTGVDDGWILNLNAPDAAVDPNRIRLGWSGDDGSMQGLTGPEINDLASGWHHLAFTRDANGLVSCWLDGISVAEGPSTQDPVSQVVPISVGRFLFGSPRSDYWWRGGAFDDIHISSVALYSETFTPAPAEANSDSVLLWSFDEGEGDVTVDSVEGVELSLASPQWVEGH